MGLNSFAASQPAACSLQTADQARSLHTLVVCIDDMLMGAHSMADVIQIEAQDLRKTHFFLGMAAGPQSPTDQAQSESAHSPRLL